MDCTPLLLRFSSSAHRNGFVKQGGKSTALEGAEKSMNIYDGSVIQSELIPGLNHTIVVWIVPICYSDSASSAQLHHLHGLVK